MFGDKHKNHKFEKLIKVYQVHLDKIKNEKEVLDDKLGEMNSQMRGIEVHIDAITQAKEERMREIDKYVETAHKSLDDQMKEKVLDLLSKKERLQKDINKLEECHTQILHQIEFCSRPKLINKSDVMATHIRNISNQVSSQKFSLGNIPAQFKSDILPEYLKGEFKILSYPQTLREKEIIYSDPLTSYGITWRLKVYPNGNGQAKGSHLSVFLEMLKGYSTPAKYDYKIEMHNHQNPLNSVSREYTSEFEVGECWGYNRLYKTEGILNEGFVSSDNNLVLKFYVRASSYAQQSSDQAKYIDKLESKLAGLKSKILSNDMQLSEEEEDKEESEKEEDHPDEDDLDKLPISACKYEKVYIYSNAYISK